MGLHVDTAALVFKFNQSRITFNLWLVRLAGFRQSVRAGC